MSKPFDMQAELQRRADKRVSKCRHFNGTINEKCEAGIAYADVRGTDPDGRTVYPCYSAGHELRCLRCVKPTPAEAMAEVLADEAESQRFFAATKAAHAHAKAAGLGKGRGGTGTLPCPVCGTGNIVYAVSAYNGHMHGQCTTKECVGWME